MSDLSQQLQLQQQINQVLADREKIIKSQKSALTSNLRQWKKLCKLMDRCGGGAEGSARAAEELKENLEESIDSAEELADEMERGADAANNAGAGGFLSKLGGFAKSGIMGILGGAMSFFQKIGGILSGAVSMIGSLIGGFFKLGFAILKLPFQMFGNLVEWIGGSGGGGPSPLKLALEEIREQFGSLASNEGAALKAGLKDIRSGFYSSAKMGTSMARIFGPGRGGMAEALKELNKMAQAAGAAFSNLKDQFAKNAEALIRLRKGLGLSDEAFGALAAQADARGEDLTKKLTEIGKQAVLLGQEFNISSKLIGKDLGEMAADMEHFGHMGTTELASIAVYSRKLGVEVKQLAGVVDKFLDFEDAAESAAKLQQAFGANVDTMKLMQAQNPAEQIEHLRQAMFRAGKSIDGMSLAERKLLSETTGLQGASLEAAFSAEKQGMSYDQINKSAKKNETVQMKQIKILKELSKNIKKTFKGGGGQVKGFWDAFTKGFGKGIRRSKEFLAMKRNIRKALRATSRLGKDVGKMFVKMFPGVKKFFGGLAEIFKPGNFKKLTKKFRDIFEIFFKDIKNSGKTGREAIGDLMKNLWKAVTEWFDMGSKGGKMVKEGTFEFGAAIWKIFSGAFDWAIDMLMMGATSIMNKIASAIDPDKSAFGTPEYKKSWSDKFIDAVGTAWDNLVKYFKRKFSGDNELFVEMKAAWNNLWDAANKDGGVVESMKEWWEKTGKPLAKALGEELMEALIEGMIWYIAGGYLLNKAGAWLVSKLFSSANPAGPATKGWVMRLAGGIKGWIGKGISKFASIGNSMADGMFSKLARWRPKGRVGSALKGFMGNAGKFVKKVGGGSFMKGAGVLGVGAAVVGGIFSGISTAVNTPGNAFAKAEAGFQEAGASILSSLSFGLVDKETIKKYGGMLSDGLEGLLTDTFGKSTETMIEESNKRLQAWTSYLNTIAKSSHQIVEEGQATVITTNELIQKAICSGDEATIKAAENLKKNIGGSLKEYQSVVAKVTEAHKKATADGASAAQKELAESQLKCLKGRMHQLSQNIKKGYDELGEKEKLLIQKQGDTVRTGVAADFLHTGKVTQENIERQARVRTDKVFEMFGNFERAVKIKNLKLKYLDKEEVDAMKSKLDRKYKELKSLRDKEHRLMNGTVTKQTHDRVAVLRANASKLRGQVTKLEGETLKQLEKVQDKYDKEGAARTKMEGTKLVKEGKKILKQISETERIAKEKAAAKAVDWDKVSKAEMINNAKTTLKKAKKNLPAVLKMIKYLSKKTVTVSAELEKLAPKLYLISKTAETSVAAQVEKVVKIVSGIDSGLEKATDIALDVKLRRFTAAAAIGSKRVKIQRGDYSLKVVVNVNLDRKGVIKNLMGGVAATQANPKLKEFGDGSVGYKPLVLVGS